MKRIDRRIMMLSVSSAVGILIVQSISAQSIQDQINQQKATWGGTQQRDYLLGNQQSPVAIPGPTPQQKMMQQGAAYLGTQLGAQINQALWGGGGNQVDPAQQAAQQADQQAQQQRTLAAEQLKKSGLYLLRQKNYAGAINEFQQALAQEPGDPDLLRDLKLAQQKISDTGVAAQNSSELARLLGNQSGNSSIPSPDVPALNLVSLDSDAAKTPLPAAPANSPAIPANVQQTLQMLDKVLDNGSVDAVKRQLDDFADAYSPQHPDLNNAPSAPETQPQIQNREQPATALNEAPGNNQNATVQQSPVEAAGGSTPTAASANPEAQTPNNAHLLDNAGNPDFDGSAGGNGAIKGNSTSTGTPAFGEANSTGVSLASSDSPAVNLSAKAGVVDPVALKGNLTDPAFSAPGKPITPTPAAASPNKNYYLEAMLNREAFVPPKATPPPPSVGALSSILARSQPILDAMYAADSSYTANLHPAGYIIIHMFTLAHDGTDASLYGKVNADGRIVNLILAFRGTTSEDGEWTYKNGPNSAGKFGDTSQAYKSAVSITTLVQRGFPGVPLTLTGHSLGGGEAALASVATGLPAITFNAAGVLPGAYGYSANAETSQITNYHVLLEPLTTIQNKLTFAATPSTALTRVLPTALGNQAGIPPVDLSIKSWKQTFGTWVETTGWHGMEEVKPAMIAYLSQ